MISQTQHRLTIVIHGCGNAMTLQHGGKIVRARAFEPVQLWVGPAAGKAMAPLSLSLCRATYPVLRECIQLGRAPEAN